MCGLTLWWIVCIWPAVRHPIRSASLCASLGGTVCLIILVINNVEVRPQDLQALLGLAAVVVLGAIYGFLTSWLVRFMERMLDKIRA
jgi:hypothetical protein